MTFTEAKDALQAWLAAIYSGDCAVIFGDQNAPPPDAMDYVTVRMLTLPVVQGSYSYRSQVDPPVDPAPALGSQEFYLDYRFTASVHVFASSDDTLLSRLNVLQRELDVGSNISTLGDLSVRQLSNVQNLTTLEGSIMHPRASIDLACSFSEKVTEDVYLIETVEAVEQNLET